MKTAYDMPTNYFSAYFHKLSEIAYESNLQLIQKQSNLYYVVVEIAYTMTYERLIK